MIADTHASVRTDLDRACVAAADALAQGNLTGAHLAFRPVHDACFWRIQRYIRAHLRASPDREAEADDLTGEVFLTFWRQIGRFDPRRGTTTALLYTIARRLTVERNRANLARQRVEVAQADEDRAGGEEPATGAEDGAVTEAEEAWRASNRASVLHVLTEEAPAVVAILALRYDEGLSFKAVAERLGVSPDAARQRDQAARVALFRAGWQLIRQAEDGSGRAKRWFRPTTAAELKALLEEAPEVGALFSEHYGAASLALISPRRSTP